MRHKQLIRIALASACGLTARAHAQDPSAGERVFKSQCSICHSSQPGRNIIGPTLSGVVGGTTPIF